jgi:hypothetical protein
MIKKTESNMNTLGIIVCYGKKGKFPPFAEAPFFLQLALEGQSIGLRVIVFNPQLIDWTSRTVSCWFVTSHGEWKTGIEPLPTLIYDRCYYHNTEHYFNYKPYVQRLSRDPQIRLLGRALGGKMQSYEILKQNPEILPYLPLTIGYQSPDDVIAILKKHDGALIKPNGGSHGRGVVAIAEHTNRFHVHGRTQTNQPFSDWLHSESKLKRWIHTFIGQTRYIIQQLLPLTTPDQRPFDVRILVQKNEEKKWETTGMAVRAGKHHTITSNLHGGGEAIPFYSFLNEHYPEPIKDKILDNIQFISSVIPPFIEQHHGPLVELGLDVGIGPDGQVWVLEINSKPGRTIFIKTGELDIRRRAVQLPIRYAHALLKNT